MCFTAAFAGIDALRFTSFAIVDDVVVTAMGDVVVGYE